MSTELLISSESTSSAALPRGIRLWPLAMIVALAAAALLYIWRVADITRAMAALYSGQTILLTLLLGLIWLLFLSRLTLKRRLISAATGVGLFVLVCLVVRIDHVSGDLVPTFRWRFAAKPHETLALPQLAAAQAKYTGGIDLSGVAPLDWPQFLGPNRDGMLAGVRLARDWEKHPPRLVWRRPIGAGWSSFAVVGNYFVTQEQRGPQELVCCYELKTGDLVWSHGGEAYYSSTIAGDGPRATPTISAGQVFTMGATGLLSKLDGATGRALWPARDVLQDTSPETAQWGKACSPLIVDETVVVTGGAEPGPALVAYNRHTGVLVWKSDDQSTGNRSYSSPLLAELCGESQIVVMKDESVSGHDPSTGRTLWEHPWPGNEPKVAQPVVLSGDRLLVASGYGVGSALWQLARDDEGQIAVTEVWKNRKLKPKFANLVHRDGYVYGLDEGILVCLEIDSGKQQWKQGRYGHGQILLVGELILVQAEQGDVVLVEASPESLREVARFPALSSKTWNNPVLVPPYLLVRNDQEAACYELTLEEPATALSAQIAP
jgi:outer membrane protein assembly factor BamB